MSGKLEGKIAVISGGTSGIGLAVAQRFVKEGAYAFIFGRRRDALDQAVQLDPGNLRAQLDGARIISRLKRRTDFGAAHHDGSVLVVFSSTDLRDAHAIARRLSSVMRHTSHGRRARSDAVVTVAALMPTDSPKSLLARLYADSRRAAG